MTRALLAFNPEAYGTRGSSLLFGVPVPDRHRLGTLPELEELEQAVQFLETQSAPQIAGVLTRVIRRAGDPALDPAIARQLLERLVRAGAMVRTALEAPSRAAGTPISPEAIFGTELEGLSPEDQELETARRFVRFAAAAARMAVRAAPGAPPEAIARHAERTAAQRLAPGLADALRAPLSGFRARRRARLGM
jgi:hypothetical protein